MGCAMGGSAIVRSGETLYVYACVRVLVRKSKIAVMRLSTAVGGTSSMLGPKCWAQKKKKKKTVAGR